MHAVRKDDKVHLAPRRLLLFLLAIALLLSQIIPCRKLWFVPQSGRIFHNKLDRPRVDSFHRPFTTLPVVLVILELSRSTVTMAGDGSEAEIKTALIPSH